MNENSSRVIDVDINDILPNRFQPRIQFDEDEILDLSDSIKEHGVIQPLVVRTIGDKYEIIAGERRYKASVLAGKDTVPVIVKNLNDKDSAEIALIENIQRKNLTPIEEALSYKKILDMGYVTQEGLAEKLGKSQPSIANKIRLLNLSDEVQEALLDNKISERHARSLLRLPTSKLQNEMLDRIIKERLTVRKTDEEIDKLKNSKINEIEEKEGKGESEMNTNLNLGEMSQQPVPNFDIFGTNNVNMPNPMPQAPVEPVTTPSPVMMSAPVQEPAVSPMMNPVDTISQNSIPSAPQQPVVEPSQVTPSIQFDANGFVVSDGTTSMPQATIEPVTTPSPVMMSTPVQEPAVSPTMNPVDTISQNSIPSVPQQPVVEPTPAVEPNQATPSIQFDANGFVVSDGTTSMPQATIEPVTTPSPVMMSTPVQEPAVSPTMNPVDTISQNSIPSVPQQPVVEPTPAVEPNQATPSIQFDANGFVVSDGTTSMPQATIEPVTTPSPVMMSTPVQEPAVSPTMNPVDTISQNSIPSVPQQPVVEPTPVVEPMQFSSNEFTLPNDMNQINSSFNQQSNQLPDITIPETKPIVDSSSFSTDTTQSTLTSQNTGISNSSSIQNSSLQEPIIITDYNKQYDPIMPTSLEHPIQKEDFKEVINAIRECSSKIEKYGYKIDVEEYDLAQLYQVIFKIEK